MDFVDQINKLGKDVYSKTRDMGEIVKLNAAITEQNSQLDRLYQALGREVWQDDDFREVIVKVYPDLSDSIKGCLSRISEYQARIKGLKRVTKCPACGAENTQDAVFCSGCGRRLAEAENAKKEKRICPACGAQLQFSDALFCTSCGTELQSQTGTESEG